MERELRGCRRCGWLFVVEDGSIRVPEHLEWEGTPCAGKGNTGFGLGPERWYSYSRGGLIFEGDEDTVKMAILPHCRNERTKIKMPPDDAFNQRLWVQTRCLACGSLVTLADYEDGPDGLLRPRR